MSMDFKRGRQAIQRIRKERGMTQEDLADKSGITSNTVSRIERGLLIPALPTLIDICNALGTGADSILAAYITADTPIRWSLLAQKLDGLDADKQDKIETVLDCLIETIWYSNIKGHLPGALADRCPLSYGFFCGLNTKT